jgi:HSP20 family protein
MAGKKELEKRKSSEVRAGEEGKERFIRPKTTIHEHEDSVTIMMDLPGVSKDTLDISFDRGELTIVGHRETWDREKMKPCYCERAEGSYRRVFSLDNTLNPSKIDAKLSQGVLELIIPKVEAAKPRRIEIKTSSRLAHK